MHPDFRGEGIGTQLLRRFEDEARNRATRRIRLSVIEPNEDAIAFSEAGDSSESANRRTNDSISNGYVYATELD